MTTSTAARRVSPSGNSVSPTEARRRLGYLLEDHAAVAAFNKMIVREMTKRTSDQSKVQDAQLRMASLSRLKTYTTRLTTLYSQRLECHAADERMTDDIAMTTRRLAALNTAILCAKIVELFTPIIASAKAAVDAADQVGNSLLLAKDVGGIAKDATESFRKKKPGAAETMFDATTLQGKLAGVTVKAGAYSDRGENRFITARSKHSGSIAKLTTSMSSAADNLKKLLMELSKVFDSKPIQDKIKYLQDIADAGASLAKDVVEFLQAVQELKKNPETAKSYDKFVAGFGNLGNAIKTLTAAYNLAKELMYLKHLSSVDRAHDSLRIKLTCGTGATLDKNALAALPSTEFKIPNPKKHYAKYRSTMKEMAKYAKALGDFNSLGDVLALGREIDRRISRHQQTVAQRSQRSLKELIRLAEMNQKRVFSLGNHLEKINSAIASLSSPKAGQKSDPGLLRRLRHEFKRSVTLYRETHILLLNIAQLQFKR